MQVINIHERYIERPPAEVGALLDSLASDADALWPRSLWPAMGFDRPLGVGADGGHGPVGYRVEEYVPGRRVKFRFTRPRGFDGHHWFDVLPAGEAAAVLRHTIDIQARGPALLTWPLAIRWLHDACLEDAFAVGQASLGLAPQVVPWSPWVKVLRWLMSGGKTRPQQLPLPSRTTS